MRCMTLLGIDLSDLGIEPITADTPETEAPAVRTGRNLVIGSVLAKTLHSVWDGAPITVVQSPPGAGDRCSGPRLRSSKTAST